MSQGKSEAKGAVDYAGSHDERANDPVDANHKASFEGCAVLDEMAMVNETSSPLYQQEGDNDQAKYLVSIRDMF